MQTSTNQASQIVLSGAGIKWLKIAVLYLVLGIGLGIVMGAKEDFTLTPVHAHINLIGWATMALAGLIYCIFPQAGESKLGKAHFWLINTSLPVMMIALSLFKLGNAGVVPVLAISEFVAAAGILSFAANIFVNVRKP
jgi:cbb3-type cytochrome oxidase subunit 1